MSDADAPATLPAVVALAFFLCTGLGATVLAGETQPDSPDDAPNDAASDSITVGYQPSWYLMAGLTGGASFRTPSSSPGGFVGLEASVVRNHRDWWVGGYLDGAWDFGFAAPVLSVGPEVGYQFLGLDAGFATRFPGGPPRPGVFARLSASFAVFTLYGRYGFWPTGGLHTIHAGASFKFPLLAPWGPGATKRSLGGRR